MSSVTSTDSSAFRPWHFFVVLTLLAATAAVLTSRTVTPEYLVMLSVTIFAAGAAALGVYRTLVPLVGRERRLSGESLSHRARAALEREKMLVLRAIKDLEFDRAMGKLAVADFDDMAARLRARALRLMQQLDAAAVAPRERLEHELAERLAREPVARQGHAPSHGRQRAAGDARAAADVRDDGDARDDEAWSAAAIGVASEEAGIECDACGVANDEDARFCKACGARLTPHPSPLPASGAREK